MGSVITAAELLEQKLIAPKPLIDKVILQGETALFLGRQKEGKSTLALQLAIDLSLGQKFLGRFETSQSTALYIDYENRLYALQQRLKDLLRDKRPENLKFVAFDKVSDRDIGLFSKGESELQEVVKRHSPSVVVLDPLRYAMSNAPERSDEQNAIAAVDHIAELRNIIPELTVIIVHHLKKRQGGDSWSSLGDDPRSWIDRIYGSQALLAHVDCIWGLERTKDGLYTFATVPRSQEELNISLEKSANSERFEYSTDPRNGFSEAEWSAWEKLPEEFSFNEATGLGIPKSTLHRMIRKAKSLSRLIESDTGNRGKRWKKSDKNAELLEPANKSL